MGSNSWQYVSPSHELAAIMHTLGKMRKSREAVFPYERSTDPRVRLQGPHQLMPDLSADPLHQVRQGRLCCRVHVDSS